MRMSARARNDVIEVDGSDASSEDEAEELDEIAPRRKKKGEWSICNVSFSNFDLANLVNGWTIQWSCIRLIITSRRRELSDCG